MGNKCCSKRQDQDVALAYPAGYKKNESSFSSNISGQKHNNGGSLDSRYTPDPNRGQLKSKGGVDIIRPRTTPCKDKHLNSLIFQLIPLFYFLRTGFAGHLKRRIVVALYNYTAREDTDVSFVKGDRMEVLDDTESDWWRVIHLTTRQEGLIPWNFVAEERSVNSEE